MQKTLNIADIGGKKKEIYNHNDDEEGFQVLRRLKIFAESKFGVNFIKY